MQHWESVVLDAAALVRRARRRAGLSQRLLAERAGVSQSWVSHVEAGRHATTVETVTQLLAAAGLQARCVLEPLLADLDERVEAFAAATPSVDVARLRRLAEELEGQRPEPVAWALDGASALAAHGLGPGAGGVEQVVLRLDQASRAWMSRIGLRSTEDRPRLSWFEVDVASGNAALGPMTLSLRGLLGVRLVEEVEAAVGVEVQGVVLPVLPVHVVEAAHPVLAELLARWRELGPVAGRTVGR